LRQLVKKVAENSLTGLEFAVGIPGTVGGAIRGNAGAWQQVIGDKVSRIQILTVEGQTKWLDQKDCRFDYRQSRFKTTREIILAAELQLARGRTAAIKKQMAQNLQKRADQPKQASAGCIFINPAKCSPFPRLTASRHGVASAGQVPHYQRSDSPVSKRSDSPGRYAASDSPVSGRRPLPEWHVAAGKLIEQCGLKGKRIGDAQISSQHANFIVNLGDARAKDVLALIQLAKKAVKEKFGVDLKLEIQFLPEVKQHG